MAPPPPPPSFRPYSTTALELSTRPVDVGIKAMDIYFPKVRHGGGSRWASQ